MQENSVSKTIYYVGIAEMVAGIILGFILGYDGSDEHWSIVLTWSVTGFVSGMLFLGFSEVIRLLDGIYSKLYDIDKNVKPSNQNLANNIKNENEVKKINIIKNEGKELTRADLYDFYLNNSTKNKDK